MEGRGILRSVPLALAIVACDSPLHSQGREVSPSALQVIWSSPITLESVPPPEVGKPYIRPREDGISLGQSIDRREQITFLARRSDFSSSADVLLEDFERNGFEKTIPVKLKGTQADSAPTLLARLFGTKENAYSRIPSIASMTIDKEGLVWVGGATDSYMDITSQQHSRAYLARLDSAAAPLWERSYKTGQVPFVVSLTPTATGNVLVAANDGWFGPSWLAMIASRDGNVFWERHVGIGKGIAVTPVEDAFLVATFDGSGTGTAYRENVAVRRVTAEGEVSAPKIVRPAINQQRGAYYGALRMSPTSDGAYIVSSWTVWSEQNPALLKPAEIAKVDADGRLVWKTTIPTSFVVRTDGGGARFCDNPAVATLPDGDALVACALKDQIHTHKFNQRSGEDTQGSLPLPSCNDGEHPVALSLFVRPDGQVLISGTRPGGNVGPGCSWLARLPTN